MSMIALDAGNGTQLPLPASQRWLLGGAGAIAPLIVLGIGVEWANVFADFKILAALGYLFKATLLFLVGGFVGFLQKGERDQFKCFLIGISAPALITTAAASNARAADRLDALAGQIQVQSIEKSFAESPLLQFARGFFGSNPNNTVALVGIEQNRQAAQRSAAAVELFTDCSIQGQIVPPAGNAASFSEKMLRASGLTSQTIVLEKTSNEYIVAVLLGEPKIALSYLNILKERVPLEPVFVINQARAYKDVTNAIETSTIKSLPDNFADNLAKQVQPGCDVKGP